MCNLCPPVADPWTGAIDEIELAEVCETLDITREVVIRVEDDASQFLGSNGAYSMPDSQEQDKHVIFMSSNLTLKQSNQTLLHELLHASQVEQFGLDEVWETMQTASGRDLLEQQVEEFADRLAVLFTVTVAKEPSLV